MDQPVSHPNANRQDGHDEPVTVRAANEPTLPFLAHLGDFFRRNALAFLIAGLVLLIVQDVFGTHGVLAMHRSQVEANRIEHEKQMLDLENQRLQSVAKDLKSDPATIEGCARSMGYARKGEVIFKLPKRSSDSACPTTPPVAEPSAPATSH